MTVFSSKFQAHISVNYMSVPMEKFLSSMWFYKYNDFILCCSFKLLPAVEKDNLPVAEISDFILN